MQQKQVHKNEICKILEIPVSSWKIEGQPTKKVAMKRLEEFKILAKKQHHMLVKRYHPDLPKNGDKEEEKLKKINAIMDIVKKLKIIEPKPTPRHVIFHGGVFHSFGNTSTSATGSTSTNSFTFRF